MKIPVVLTAFICTCGMVSAQQSSSSSQDVSSSGQVNQSPAASQGSDIQKNDQIINEPSGAQAPSSSSQVDQSTPPGRAFSTNNAPEGRPFQENPGLPPGQRKQQIKEGEQGGIPNVNEPAGAQRPDQSSTSGSSSSATSNTSGASATSSSSTNSVSGAEVISSPKSGGSASSTSSSSGTIKPGDPGYAAGAQRQNSTRLQHALAQFKTSGTVSSEQRTQLQQTLSSMVTSSQQVAPEFITRLSEDLSTSLSKIEVREDMRTRLANDIAVILSAQPSTQNEIQTAFTDAQSILLSGTTPTPQARAAICDLHLIANQLVPDLRLNLNP